MNERFSCALNGVSITSLDPAIRVTDLTELPPRMRVTTVPTARHGLRLLRRVRESLTVRVTLLIAQFDPARRRDLLARLHAWADPGGLLTVSDRPGQQLHVSCATLPMMSALSWSDEMTIDFTAYGTPFWEAEEETEVVTGDADALTLPGSADGCPVSAMIAHLGSGTMTTLTLRCGDTQMTFDGLNAVPGSIIRIDCTAGQLQAVCGEESLLMKRTADSSDLLLADGGEQTDVAVSADQAVQAVFHGRGRWL